MTTTEVNNLDANKTILVDGISINYSISLLPNNDFTVVLIHGFGASLETWNDIYPFLCKNYSVIRMDLKGSGLSSKPRDNKYKLSDQAYILMQFLMELNQTNVVLVGHSLGGGVALLTYFESLSKHFGIKVKGLVLIDSAGYPQSLPFFIKAVRNPIVRFLSYFTTAEFRVRLVLERIYKVKEKITSERVERYAFSLNQPGSEYALHQTANQIVPNNISELTAKFPTVAIPTLIVWGKDDPVIPIENAHLFNHDIPNSRLFILDNTGHVPHEERPEETFAAINQFLKSLI
jgi:pimeloyl-ACP methyl ester carboxylesterase